MVYESEYRRPYVSSRPSLSTYSVTVGGKVEFFVLQKKIFLEKIWEFKISIWRKLNFVTKNKRIWWPLSVWFLTEKKVQITISINQVKTL